MKHKISRKLIVRRSISLALLGIYIAIALLNSTVVQSYVGAAVSSYSGRALQIRGDIQNSGSVSFEI